MDKKSFYNSKVFEKIVYCFPDGNRELGAKELIERKPDKVGFRKSSEKENSEALLEYIVCSY